jgi:hypothetical protein
LPLETLARGGLGAFARRRQGELTTDELPVDSGRGGTKLRNPV